MLGMDIKTKKPSPHSRIMSRPNRASPAPGTLGGWAPRHNTAAVYSAGPHQHVNINHANPVLLGAWAPYRNRRGGVLGRPLVHDPGGLLNSLRTRGLRVARLRTRHDLSGHLPLTQTVAPARIIKQ